MVSRLLESKIVELIEHFPAVAILGARQVGKTTLAKMLIKKLPMETIYLDLENPLDWVRLENAITFLKANQEKCVVIDEVQRRVDLFPILRSVIDEYRKPGRFLLLGSANPMLRQESAETLAGRIVNTELTGLNILEIRNHVPLEHHWLWGGFPEPLLMKDPVIRIEWFKAFVMTYIERDLRMLGLTAESQNLLRFLTMVAHAIGGILNKSTFAKSLGTSVPTISKYIDYLVNSFILRLLTPYHTNVKKRLVKSPKIYLRDSGLLHYLLRIHEFNDLMGHPIVGHSWEAYVIEQIVSVLGDQFEYFFYRTQEGAECDLVIAEGFRPTISVEIKFTNTPQKTKSLTFALQDLQTKRNFVVIPECSTPYPMDKHITVCNLEQFFEMIEFA